MKNEIKITRQELAELLSDPKIYRGCNFVGFDMLTSVKLTGGKGNSMQGEIQKVHTGFVAMLFSNKVRSAYGKMVNKRLTEQGDEANFEPSKLPWGTRTPETAHIGHTNKQGEYNDYVQLIYVQHSVKLMDLAEQMGVQLSDKDVELAQLMREKVVGYNTPNGNISYLRNGEAIDKENIEGLPTKKDNGKQGGLKDEMKVIVRSPKLSSINRMTLNGTVYTIED